MMMPANYSVIAENEMTYVNGGALIDCFAPALSYCLIHWTFFLSLDFSIHL